jgi:hypothetical protein
LSPLRSRLLVLAAAGASAFLALRPATRAERALEMALTPLRALSELARPVGLIRARKVRAAERATADELAGELEVRRALGRGERRFVLPDEERLLSGRDFVLGEVVGRVGNDADRLEVRLLGARAPAEEGLAAGMPVTVGNHYVGRVHSLLGELVRVDLVTRSDGFVGARLEGVDGPARLVVGGVLPRARRGAERLLAVHNPQFESQLAELEGAEVRVADDLSGSPWAELAEGFRLGHAVLLSGTRGEPSVGVRADPDFAGGLFQVALIRPAARRAGQAGLEVDPLDDPHWTAATALSSGDPTGAREGVVLDAGALRGVREGAAVVAGARLVGRIGCARPLASSARLMGDPGLALPVLAQVEGLERPLILGWLVALGRADAPDATPRALFHWQRGWPAGIDAGSSGETARARLYTGAGAAGVPPWLFIGHAELPRQAGPQVITVELPVDPRDLAHVRVRSSQPSERAEATP